MNTKLHGGMPGQALGGFNPISIEDALPFPNAVRRDSEKKPLQMLLCLLYNASYTAGCRLSFTKVAGPILGERAVRSQGTIIPSSSAFFDWRCTPFCEQSLPKDSERVGPTSPASDRQSRRFDGPQPLSWCPAGLEEDRDTHGRG